MKVLQFLPLSAAICTAAPALAGGSSGPYVELRWIERSGQTQILPGAAPGVLNADDSFDATIWLTLEARLVSNGHTNVLGFAGTAGHLVTNDLRANGDWKLQGGYNASPATTTSAPNFTFPLGLPHHRAVFAPYRSHADLFIPTTGLPDPSGGQFSELRNISIISGPTYIEPLANGEVDGAGFGLDTWVPIYTVQYDVTNLSPRTITFSFVSGGGMVDVAALTGWDENLSPTVISVPGIAVPTYTVNVLPSPGAGLAMLTLATLSLGRRPRKLTCAGPSRL